MLLVTAWQVNWGRPPAGLSAEEMARLGLARSRRVGRFAVTNRAVVRLAAAVLAIVATVWVWRAPGLLPAVVPETAGYLEPAIVGLVALGLVGLTTSAEPLPSGIGLLLFLTGFALYYGLLDQSIAMTVALVVAQLTVALVVAYLAQARYLPVDILE